MQPRLTIGELARAAGVAASTVRFYERRRLLRPSARSLSNYRLYTREDLERLRFIRAAQAVGFTLADVQALLRPAPCARVQTLIEDRLGEVARRLSELRRVQRVLARSLRACRAHEPSGRCRALEDLAGRARGEAGGQKTGR